MTTGIDGTPVAGRYVPNPVRLGALVAGLAFIGAFVSVFYGIVDVAGDTSWLLAAVALALLLATACAVVLPVRVAVAVGTALLVAGVGLYVHLAPFGYRQTLTVGFLRNLAVYLTGVSVLQFRRVDVWAVALAPAPVFLTWFLFVRRQYDYGALVGGVTLVIFVLTGDATRTTALIGSTSVLGVLALGDRERLGWSWEPIERLGWMLVATVLLSKLLSSPDGSAGSQPRDGTGGEASPVESSLVETDASVDVFDRITLSARVQFTVTADAVADWHVASYDRYTGDGWVRTGGTTPYAGPATPPPGETTTVEQTVRAEAPARTMPAAWKPVRVVGEAAERTEVTATGGLAPGVPFVAGDEYTVVSRVVDATPERLRAATGSVPDRIRRQYLQLPGSTPERVRRKAREITADAATAYDAAAAVEEWLGTNKSYSLGVDRPDDRITDAFLFERDGGYCVYFATAMTVLLRSLDVPARFAHGYLPGERVADDRWVVRGFDSHAWTEVYFPDVGWVSFDPTPADPRRRAERERLERARSAGIPGVDTDGTRPTTDTPTPAGAGTEAPTNRTASTATATTATGDGTRTPPAEPNAETRDAAEPGSALPDEARRVGERASTTIARMDRLTFVTAVAGIALGVHRSDLLGRGYRYARIRWQRPTDSPERDVERAFERLESHLARRHRPREPDETARQYVEALAPNVDPTACEVLRRYERARYGGTVSRAEADETIRLVDVLVRERG